MKEQITDIFNEFFDNRMSNIFTVLPGRFEEYYGHAERKAKVKPMIKHKTRDGENLSIDPIDDVPVMFPPSTKDFNILCPISKGDKCILLFSKSPIGNYQDGAGEETEADDFTQFMLTDCIAIPGGPYPYKETPTPPENDNDFFLTFENAIIQMKKSTNDIIVKNDNTTIELSTSGDITISNSGGEIKIDAAGNITLNNGTEPFILGTVFDTWMSGFITALGAHIHTDSMGGSTTTPTAPIIGPSNYLSQKIKGA